MSKSKTDPKTLLVSGPFVGMDRNKNSRRLALKEARDAYNCDLDGETVKGRSGFDAGATAPNGKPVDSQFDYRKADGSRTHLVKAGDQLYSLSGTTFTAIGSGGLTEANLAQFVVIGGKCYIAHGGTPKVTDGTSLYDWRIAGPSYAPDIASVASGLLNGTYDYKITYYSSAWGTESPASPPTDESDTATPGIKTTAIDLTDQWVTLSNLPSSSDSRVDRLRIYRRNLSNYESDWYLTEEIPAGATSWTDRTPDNSRSTRFAPLTYTDTYPEGRIVAHNQGVTYLAGIAGDPSSLWYTRQGSMAVIDREIIDDDGGEISGLLSFHGQLVVFTTRSIWVLSGVPPYGHSLRRVVRDRGCLAPFSIVPVDNSVLFLSENGVYAWTGSEVREVSRPVKPLWLARNFTLDWKVRGTHDIGTSSVWWNYGTSSETTTASMLVYFYRNTAVVGRHSWARWAIPGAVSAEQITDGATNTRKTHVGFSDGRVVAYGSGTTDNGTDISWFWETGDEDVDVPTRRKHWGELAIETSGGGPEVLSVEVSQDGSGTFEPAGVVTAMEQDFRRFALRRQAAQLAIRINCAGGGELVSWAFDVQRSVRT